MASTQVLREELVNRLTNGLGAPLSTYDMENLLKTPNSFVNQAIAGYINMEQQKEIAAEWNHLMNVLNDLKRLLHRSVKKAVEEVDDTRIAQVVSIYNPVPSEKIDNSINLQKLMLELTSLKNWSQDLSTLLIEKKAAQRVNFDNAIATIPPALKAKLQFQTLDESKQEELEKWYEQKVERMEKKNERVRKDITEDFAKAFEKNRRPEFRNDQLFEAAFKKEFEQLEKTVNSVKSFLTSIEMAGKLLVGEQEKNLTPSEVKKARAALNALTQGVEENHVIIQTKITVDIKIELKNKEIRQLQSHNTVSYEPKTPFNMKLERK